MRLTRFARAALVAAAVPCLSALAAASGPPVRQDNASPSASELLDRYRKGGFDAAIQRAAATDSAQVRSSFTAAADTWIARDPSDVINRRLVATAFAIELAHARLAYDSPTLMALLDWARKEWHKGPPSAVERVWTRAAVALIGRGGGRLTVAAGGADSLQKSSTFLEGAVKRFPDDAQIRFALLLSQLPPPNARNLKPLTEDPDGGPIILLELAYLTFEGGDPEAARRFAEQAGTRSAEPWTRYLAHFIAAFCHEYQKRYQDAVREYAAALEAVPHAQSASIALAQLLLRDNQADAAFDLINRSVTERPDGDDPWRLFAYGTYVRWPVLIADVRKAIR
jgi:tetratricopeptide (TPR) repeat protein